MHVASQRRGLVLSADVETLDDLKRLAELAASSTAGLVALKIGAMLALRHGLPASIRATAEVCNLPIIYDHQKGGTDIPQMGRPFARACRDAGVDAVIFFPLSGPRSLEAFVSSAKEEGLVPLIGLLMTHPAYLVSEGGYIDDSAPDSICSIALGLGVRDFVLPATKPRATLRLAAGPLSRVEARLFMPGVGSQGASIADAVEAAHPHAVFPILGSAVYNSPDPLAALRAFREQLSYATSQ